MNAAAITTRSLLQYGFIALPIAFGGFPLYALAPDFYATHHGLSLGLLGALLLAIRLFDAVQDPLIGWFIDSLRGRLLTVITIAATALCLGVLCLFNLMVLSPAVWFCLSMLVATSAYSVLVIVLGTQAALWTEDPDMQTRIAVTREGFGLIGLVIAVSMPMALSYLVAPKWIYLSYAAVLATLMLSGVTSLARLFAKLPASSIPPRGGQVSLASALRALPISSLRLFMVYGLSMLAASIPAVLVIFFVRDLLHAEHLGGVFLLLYFLSGAAGMPFWKKLSAATGKYKAWAFSSLLAFVTFTGAVLLGPGDIWLFAIVCVLSGSALGADLILPPSILAEHIHQHRNTAFSGTHYACLAFIAKVSLALASAIALPLLDLAGFLPGTANTELALATLAIAYALVPGVLKLLAAVLLYLFFIRAKSGGNIEDHSDHCNYRSSHHA